MNQPLLNISSFLSVSAGLISILFTLFSLASAYEIQKVKLQAAHIENLNNILKSNSLVEFGHYIDEVLGNFTLYEYAQYPKVSKSVNTTIERLKFFLGTESEVKKQLEEIETPPKIEVPKDLPAEIDHVLKDINSGEIWNALARLRRFIEINLRELAEAHEIGLDRPSSAGYLLRILSQKRLIPTDSVSNLKYAITVCNKAIHGYEVNIGEATEATYHADIGLRRLKERNDGIPVVVGGKISAGQATSVTQQPADQKMKKVVICPECNAELPVGTKFCTECGTQIGR